MLLMALGWGGGQQNTDGCHFVVLLQREQEYAEARLRILGEARSPEEQLQIATNDRWEVSFKLLMNIGLL